MKFRFTKEHFENEDFTTDTASEIEQLVNHCNTILDAERERCHRVWRNSKATDAIWSEHGRDFDTHTALLFDTEELKTEGEPNGT